MKTTRCVDNVEMASTIPNGPAEFFFPKITSPEINPNVRSKFNSL